MQFMCNSERFPTDCYEIKKNIIIFCVFVYSSVETSFGPMSRDVDGLVQAMRAIWDGYMFDLDPSVVPMTFDEEVSVFKAL